MPSRRALVALVLAGFVAFALAACGDNGGGAKRAPTVSSAVTATGSLTSTMPPAIDRRGSKPNIVFVLTDDLSLDLLRYMPRVQQMARQGASFQNYFVTDSLCCPSRSSIFTGEFPHDTGVFTNSGADGGIGAFYSHGNEQNGFNIRLQQAGYRTALMGKYLNGYLTAASPVPATFVPPGWDAWDVAGNGYHEFNYALNENGRLQRYGHQPRDYLVDVMAAKGAGFIADAARANRPFFLELATFAPHAPYVPAPRYRGTFPLLEAPRPPSYDTLPTAAPSWLAGRPPLNALQEVTINRAYRKRVRDVQGVDDMITRIETALQQAHLLRNTYVVFSSDNGYHMGEYRLMPGKQTAFDTDIHVPLVIDGPGVPAGVRTRATVQNIDLAPTFEQIAGVPGAGDGHSVMATLAGGTPSGWRNAALVEHHGPDFDFAHDPDAQAASRGDPTTYEAMRTAAFTYVEYRDGEREYYDLHTDPEELHNVYAGLPSGTKTRLHAELGRMEGCHSASACWAAEHVSL